MATTLIQDFLANRVLAPELRERVDRAMGLLNSAGYDRWGMDPEAIKAGLVLGAWLYRHYFRVDASGLERIPPGRALLVSNHGGQFPLDALLIGLAVLLEGEPPRAPRAMVERWFPKLPYLGNMFTMIGHMLGDSRNCKDLLEHEQCVLVFPEGARGSGKLLKDRYRLQRFGTGFLRIALETRSPVVPVAVVGCEEAYPAFANSRTLAALFQAPYFPITPLFPFLGLMGFLPLPTKVVIRFGEPIHVVGDPDEPELEIEKRIVRVRRTIRRELAAGLRHRSGRVFTGAAESS